MKVSHELRAYLIRETFPNMYARGELSANYPVPAIPVVVEWIPRTLRHPLSNSIMLFRAYSVCYCGCGEMDVVAVVDFDNIRCFEYFLPLGEYVNRREWEEGIQAYIEVGTTNATIQ